MNTLRDLSTDPRVATLATNVTQLLQLIHTIRNDATTVNSELHLAMIDEPDTRIDDLLLMGANHFRAVMENANTALTALTHVVGNCRMAPTLLTQLADRVDELHAESAP